MSFQSLRRGKIFGACKPPLAHQALQAELEVGQVRDKLARALSQLS